MQSQQSTVSYSFVYILPEKTRHSTGEVHHVVDTAGLVDPARGHRRHVERGGFHIVEEPVHVHDIQATIKELGMEALDENAEWLILHRARPLEPVMAG